MNLNTSLAKYIRLLFLMLVLTPYAIGFTFQHRDTLLTQFINSNSKSNKEIILNHMSATETPTLKKNKQNITTI